MSQIPILPEEIIKIILAKLDCSIDISNCALVCREWLQIINNNRAIPKTIVIDACSVPDCNIMRRFRDVIFFDFNFSESFDAVDRNLQYADNVTLKGCDFPDYATVRQIRVACGDLSRLEIINPDIWDQDTLNFQVSHASTQKIKTLVLRLNDESSWQILKLVHMSSILVENLEVYIESMLSPGEEFPLLSLLEQHYQDQLRGIKVDTVSEFFTNNDKNMHTKLAAFPRLKLHTLAVFTDENLEDLLRRQPTITHLMVCTNLPLVTECVLANLTLLTHLQVNYEFEFDLGTITTYGHHFTGLESLEIIIGANYLNDELDISFIAKLKKLRKFVCWCKGVPQRQLTLKLEGIEAPLLELREFRIFSVPEFDDDMEIEHESMLTVMDQMPNLEKLTLLSTCIDPCIFGAMNALKKLRVSFNIIEMVPCIESMKFPNLRYLVISSQEALTPLVDYFPQIAANCPLLSQITLYNDSTRFQRNANGVFEKNSTEFIRLTRPIDD